MAVREAVKDFEFPQEVFTRDQLASGDGRDRVTVGNSGGGSYRAKVWKNGLTPTE